MTTTAFTLMFLPACLAVPAGLALGIVSELVIEGIGAAFARSEDCAAGPRPASAAAADFRAARGEGRRDVPAFLDALGGVGPAPWM